MDAREGRYGFMRADMGSRGRDVMGLESRAVSARVIKHFVTIFSKTCNKSISLPVATSCDYYYN